MTIECIAAVFIFTFSVNRKFEFNRCYLWCFHWNVNSFSPNSPPPGQCIRTFDFHFIFVHLNCNQLFSQCFRKTIKWSWNCFLMKCKHSKLQHCQKRRQIKATGLKWNTFLEMDVWQLKCRSTDGVMPPGITIVLLLLFIVFKMN